MNRAPMLNEEWLREQYITCGRTRNSIANETGLTPGRIGNLLQKYEIKRYSVDRHGLSKHPLNVVWCGIKERCTNKNASNYKWYGAKGISVCDEWLDFKSFYQWAMDNGWERGLTVDRIDTSKGYSPDNCRLVTLKQQCRNRSSNVVIEAAGECRLQCEWEEELGLKPKTIAKWKMRNGIEYVITRIEGMMENDYKDNRG